MGALIFDHSRLLIVERGRDPLKGYWSLPGGAVETGELLENAIRREVMEETGLTIADLKFFDIYERLIPDASGRIEYHYVLVDYTCTAAGGTLAPGDDVSAAQWITQQELAAYRLTEGTLEVIERAFLLHESNQR